MMFLKFLILTIQPKKHDARKWLVILVGIFIYTLFIFIHHSYFFMVAKPE